MCVYVCVYVYVCVCMHVYVCMHNIWGELSGGNVLPKTGGGIVRGIVRGKCPGELSGGIVLYPFVRLILFTESNIDFPSLVVAR